ncbi:hypothetical protein MNBD_NITROSPINAE02-108 [hydrothermal vent metagenome]|uniref:Cyclic nucleotide-binding domain-containing protein n=1 Tax=hydrothermal vent metagenome TaxID=652676 RepID=A0A3B1CYA8_9ZZZZ
MCAQLLKMPSGQKEVVDILSGMKTLDGLSPIQLARLARLDVTRWGPDEFLIQEGEANIGEMIILLSGKIYIRKKVNQSSGATYEQLRELEAPTLVGEDSFFTGLKRSAGVWAKKRVAGLLVNHDEFNRMVCLDKISGAGFIKKLSLECQVRAEKTLNLYFGMLKLVFNREKIAREFFYCSAMENRKLLLETKGDVADWIEVAAKIMMCTREINNALEDLYHFANLPDMKATSVDKSGFRLSPDHQFHRVMRSLLEELDNAQKHVSLGSLNMKETLASIIISGQESGRIIDYQLMVSLLNQAYSLAMSHSAELGFTITVLDVSRVEDKKVEEGRSLLWD